MTTKALDRPKREVAPAAPATEAAALMQVITRAASDPSIDIVKLERLMGMYNDINVRNGEREFNEAMSAAQGEMRRVAQDSANPSTRSRYASYAALDAATRPIYTAHGFGLSFNTAVAPETMVRVICHVTRGGFSREYAVDMPADGKGAKGGDVMTKTHATGSAITYGRRYLLAMIFNLAIGGNVDDDGNGAGGGDTVITAEQVKTLRALIADTGVVEDKFLAYLKVERLEDIKANDYERGHAALMKRQAEKETAK